MSDTAFGQPAIAAAIPKPSQVSRADAPALASFAASLQGHQICFVVPAGSVIDALTVDLPGGILILGAMRGRVQCRTGSAIVAKGGEFQGVLEASDVLVEGKITSPEMASEKSAIGMSEVRARGQRNAQGAVVGGILALSANAYVCAKLQAVAYQIPRTADLSRSVLEVIPPGTV